MTRSKWTVRIFKWMLWITPGATLLATSCGAEIRTSVFGAGADFVGDSFGTVLSALFPVEDWVSPSTEG